MKAVGRVRNLPINSTEGLKRRKSLQRDVPEEPRVSGTLRMREGR